jgi:hypothetical protein
MWFDTTTGTRVDAGAALIPATANFDISCTVFVDSLPSVNSGIIAQYTQTGAGRLALSYDTDGKVTLFVNAGTNILIKTSVIPLGQANEIRITRSSNTFSLYLNGNLEAQQTQAGVSVLQGQNTLIGTTFFDILVEYRGITGLLYDVTFLGVSSYFGYGNTNADWTDQIGSNNGTVNGNPVTVGQKRETILQTAGEDFNRGENILLYSEDVLNASVWTVNAAYSTTLTLPVTGPNGDTVNAIHLKKTFGAGRRIDQAAPASAFTIFAWVRAGDYGTIKNTFVFGVRTGANPSVSIISGVGSVAAPVSGGVTISGLSAASWTLVKATYTGSPSEFYIQQGAGGDTGSCYVYQLQATASSDYADNVYLTTEANALENVFIPESETTAGQDALGNAIENPRPNERVLNLTTGTGYATVADNDSLDLGTSSLVTHEFWIKIEDGSVNHRIIDKASSVNGIGLQYISSISSIRVTFRTQSNSTSTWDGATDIADGQWHHIIVRLNNRQTTPVAGDVSILIDGADDSATLFNSASNLTATLTNAEPLHIGFNDDFPTQKLVGQIGDVRQYDRALTADEVLKNYNARKGAYGL